MEKQEPIREIVLGGIAGEMIIEAYKWLLRVTRQYGLDQAVSDPSELKLTLADAFNFPDTNLTGRYHAARVAFPEDNIWGWLTVERVIVLEDTNPERNHGEQKAVGLVLLRATDEGPFRGSKGVWRLKCSLDAAYAVNRNTYRYNWTIEPLSVPKQEDVTLAQLIS